MKKLQYIQPSTQVIELNQQDAILQSTSDIETQDPRGVNNGFDENDF